MKYVFQNDIDVISTYNFFTEKKDSSLLLSNSNHLPPEFYLAKEVYFYLLMAGFLVSPLIFITVMYYVMRRQVLCKYLRWRGSVIY